MRAASRGSIGVSFSYLGQRCREKVRLAPTPANMKFVERLKARIEHEIATGVFDYGKHFPTSKRARRLARTPSATVTVGELLTEWCKHVRPQLQPETFEDYAEYIRNTWAPRFGVMRLCDFGMVDVTRWIAEQTCSRKRILNLLTPLRQALRYAVVPARLLPADPLAGVRVQRPAALKDEVIDPLSFAEISAVLPHLEPQIANMMELWAWTGLRQGELFALTWADVDFDRGVIRVNKAMRGARRKVPKTRAGVRDVKILPPAAAALTRQKALTRMLHREVFLDLGHDAPYALAAFPGKLRHYPATHRPFADHKALRRRWQRACAAAGVRYRFPRQLRHTYASWMLGAGESPLWVAKQMGHADSSITLRVYAKWIPEMHRDAGISAWQKIVRQE